MSGRISPWGESGNQGGHVSSLGASRGDSGVQNNPNESGG